MQILVISFIAIVVVLFGLIALAFSLRLTTGDEYANRLQEFVAEPLAASPNARPINVDRTDELKGSLVSRIVVPAFQRLGGLLGRLTPASSLEKLGRKLAIAGHPLGLGAREFYGLQLAFILLGLWLAFILLRSGLTMDSLLFATSVFLSTMYIPRRWLNSRVYKRQNQIRRGLPDALDMLSVCAEAGLGFDQSIQRVSEHWKTPVAMELGRVVTEMEMGLSRAEALRGMADRLEVEELSSFVAVILQSDQLGMSIADTLTAQAASMREERRFRAQEQARKVPLKMLFPMLLLILPALFAVILGPAIPTMAEVFAQMRVGR